MSDDLQELVCHQVKIGSIDMLEIRADFWVPLGTAFREEGGYREYWLDGMLILAEPIVREGTA